MSSFRSLCIDLVRYFVRYVSLSYLCIHLFLDVCSSFFMYVVLSLFSYFFS